MANYLHLIQTPTRSVKRHGGPDEVRTFELYINGILIEMFQDNYPSSYYKSLDNLDRYINQKVKTLERALGCKVIRGRARS